MALILGQSYFPKHIQIVFGVSFKNVNIIFKDIEVSFYERQTVELADFIVAPSFYIVKYLHLRQWKIPPYLRIFNIITPPKKRSFFCSRQDNLQELVFFGRLEPRKGLDVFLGALDESYQQLKNLKKISFLGRDLIITGRGSQKNYIKQYWQNSKWSYIF